MKDKKQFFKENIIGCIFFNIPPIIGLSILLPNIISDIFYSVGVTILISLYLLFNSLDDWYNDYRFTELEKQVKQLKDNQNVHIQQD